MSMYMRVHSSISSGILEASTVALTPSRQELLQLPLQSIFTLFSPLSMSSLLERYLVEVAHGTENSWNAPSREVASGAAMNHPTVDLFDSDGCFSRRLQDPVVEEIEERLANWTQIPVENQEDMQVLRYVNRQQYGAHSDVLSKETPRMATVLMYLSGERPAGHVRWPYKRSY